MRSHQYSDLDTHSDIDLAASKHADAIVDAVFEQHELTTSRRAARAPRDYAIFMASNQENSYGAF